MKSISVVPSQDPVGFSQLMIHFFICLPIDAAPEVKRANVARQFKGLTCQLFNHYSDALRQQIFGPAEGKENPQMPPGSALVDVEYD
ncbi:MAG TPA: hypothetical protein VMU26_05295 [Candidatus Polarisedimenticolia bacterium]|nr:hypothetical protein [Candidatus Polarisedimenticolia bacterium]